MKNYWALILLCVALLSGCAGTIQRENGSMKATFATTSINSVELKLSEEATLLQAENPIFSQKELLDFIERKLGGLDLVKADSPYRAEITINRFRIRSAFNAIMWGIMAGADSIDGKVRIFDSGNKQVHAFDVTASYGLGGIAGGDSTRINWLYNKFTELAVAEMMGKTDFTDIRQANKQKIEASRKAAKQPLQSEFALPLDTGFAELANAEAIPYVGQFAKDSYALYLTRPLPRSFVISENGHWAYRTGKDALASALITCQNLAKSNCYPYAIDDHIVWKTDAAERELMRRQLLAEIASHRNTKTAAAQKIMPPTEPGK
ncbi:hypothetical protein DXT88_19700 [Herbaspirillum lusitanum]|uniref:DUF4410 domain-containing protein n=1 Tax=Herbaspirillum lusitanum TaxID=213312 RepID=UPI002237D703|nr:DUF4410 domain-containing protein [Herbaspirillum lusitanum]MCW5300402.1 hypothetical protein [Herbaspirillum lusitanum]